MPKIEEINKEEALERLEDLITRNAKPGDELEGVFPPYVVDALEQAAVALRLLDMIGERKSAPGPRVLIVTGYNSGYLLRDGVTLEDAAPVLAGAVKVSDSYGTWREDKGHLEVQTIPRGHKSLMTIEAEEIVERGRQHEMADHEARFAFERTDDYRLAVKLGEEAAIMGMGFPDCPYKGEEEPGLTFGWILGYRATMNAQAKAANVSRGEDVEKRIAEGAADPDPFAQGRAAAIAGHDMSLNPYDFNSDRERAGAWNDGFETVEQDDAPPVISSGGEGMPAEDTGETYDGSADKEIAEMEKAELPKWLEGAKAAERGDTCVACPYCGVGDPVNKAAWVKGWDAYYQAKERGQADAAKGVPRWNSPYAPLFDVNLEDNATVRAKVLDGAWIAGVDSFHDSKDPAVPPVLREASIHAPEAALAGGPQEEKEDPEGGY